jgi:hypothetical protein
MTYVAVDLAGFSTEAGKRNSEIKQRDSTAIAVVTSYPMQDGGNNAWGWHVREIRHGQWGVRETALNILMACKDNQAVECGIEKGALQKAVEPYLNDYMREYGQYLNVHELTHGNKAKFDRIRWSLEGRCEKGRVSLQPGDWNDLLIEQACGFPSRLVHDDLLDALSYIDQMAEATSYDLDDFEEIRFDPVDSYSGY